MAIVLEASVRLSFTRCVSVCLEVFRFRRPLTLTFDLDGCACADTVEF